jgi:hypothetical protein
MTPPLNFPCSILTDLHNPSSKTKSLHSFIFQIIFNPVRKEKKQK